MLKPADNLNQVITIKGTFPIVYSWLFISFAIFLSLQNIYLYPITLLIIINRIMALGLLTHEAIHQNLSKNKILNDFLGKYACGLPVFISFERWKTLHLMHHRFVGTEADPDRYLYQFYPITFKNFCYQLLSGKLILFHFIYFTDLGKNLFNVPFKKIDRLIFIAFHILLIVIFFHFKIINYYFIFWCIPFIFCIPLTLLYNCLEHHECYKLKDENKKSRTIILSNLFQKIILPLNVQFHGEHHLHPNIPQYNLEKLHKHILINNSNVLFYERFNLILNKLL